MWNGVRPQASRFLLKVLSDTTGGFSSDIASQGVQQGAGKPGQSQRNRRIAPHRAAYVELRCIEAEHSRRTRSNLHTLTACWWSADHRTTVISLYGHVQQTG